MKEVKLTFDDVPCVLGNLLQKVEQLEKLLIAHEEQNPANRQEDLMNVDGAAKLLGLTRSGIYSKIYKREIPFIKLQHSSRVRFSRKALTAWLMEGQRQAA